MRGIMAAWLLGFAPTFAGAATLIPGSDVTLTVVSSTIGQLSSTTFQVVDGVDETLGHLHFDVNVDGTDAFLMSVDFEENCGFASCIEGDSISFILSGLQFDGGEVLADFSATAAAELFQQVTVIDGSSLSFTFSEHGFVPVEELVLSGNFLTAPASPPSVPLPASGVLFLAGLGTLLSIRRHLRS